MKCRSVRLSQKEKCDSTDHANGANHPCVADEIRIDHERDAAEHRLPKMHAFSIDKGDETDGTENQSADQIPGARYLELNASHISVLEDPQRFTNEVLTFLTE